MAGIPAQHPKGDAFGVPCSLLSAAVPWHILRSSGELSAAMNAEQNSSNVLKLPGRLMQGSPPSLYLALLIRGSARCAGDGRTNKLIN